MKKLSIISENLKQAYTESSIGYCEQKPLEKFGLWITIISGIVGLLTIWLVLPQQIQFLGLTINTGGLTISIIAVLIALHLHLRKHGQEKIRQEENKKKETSTQPLPSIDWLDLEAKLPLRIPEISPIDRLVMTHLEHLKTDPTLPKNDAKLKNLQSLVQGEISATNFVKSYLIAEFSHGPKLEPSIHRQVIQHLGQLHNHTEDTKLPLVVDFILDGDSQKFSTAWRQWKPDPSSLRPSETTPNYEVLAERIKRKEIVLFLGSDLSNAIVQPLADFCKYEGFKGIFPKICEYVQLHPDYQRTQLCYQVRKELQTQRQSLSTAVVRNDLVPFYELLAKVSQPLILISTCYDSLLEDTLTKQGKKFALLFYSHKQKLFIHYCDQNTPQSLGGDEEKWYAQNPLQKGYTLIYKIRGYFNSQEDCLTLSEQDYFNWATAVDKYIPNQLATLLQDKSLWCLGQSLQTWADRFLLNAIFQKRGKLPGKTSVVQKDPDEFAKVYWADKGARIYDKIDLSEFVEKLEVAMSRYLTTTI